VLSLSREEMRHIIINSPGLEFPMVIEFLLFKYSPRDKAVAGKFLTALVQEVGVVK